MNPRGPGVDDTLVNLALILITALAVIAALLRAAGTLAALAAGTPPPRGGWESGLRVLARPGDPGGALDADGLAAYLYWPVLAALVTAVAAIAIALWRGLGSIRHTTTHNPARLAGIATGRDIRAVASQRALLSRAATLRPSLNKPKPSDVGYLLGRSRGRQVWASVEDSTLVLGPPRSGKGLHVVINAILDAPGAVAPRDRAACGPVPDHGAPTARMAPGQPHPIPAPPDEPAAARRRAHR